MKAKTWALASMLALALAPAARAGGESSGHADNFLMSEAFFRSADPSATISLCYEVSPSFGVPAAQVESILRWAFKEWDAYIESTDLRYAVWTGSPGIVGKLGSVKQGCAGGEDLRAYFGVSTPEVDALKSQLIRPYGFVSTINGDKQMYWKKGVLWIVGPSEVDPAKGIPRWELNKSPGSVPYGALKYLVLHEVGHIFGNNHVDWTIMTDRAAQSLNYWADPQSPSVIQPYEIRIDQVLELVPNVNLAKRYELASKYGFRWENGSRHFPNPEALAQAFQKIFGKAPSGALSATAFRPENPNRQPHRRPDEIYAGTGNLELEFKDATGAHKASIRVQSKIAQKDESAPLFNGQHGNHYRSFGISFFGYLEVDGQRRFPVIVNYNMGNALSIVDPSSKDGEENPLLTAVSPNGEGR